MFDQVEKNRKVQSLLNDFDELFKEMAALPKMLHLLGNDPMKEDIFALYFSINTTTEKYKESQKKYKKYKKLQKEYKECKKTAKKI